jgi:hypothetical protein
MNSTTSTTRLKLEKSTGATLTTASLVAAAPLEALLAALSRDITYIKNRLPGSGELAMLQRHRDELARALDEARRADVWLSPKEVAAHTHKGLSTVTKDCRELGEVVGAVPNGKRSWRIHWPTYEAWMLAGGRKKAA